MKKLLIVFMSAFMTLSVSSMAGCNWGQLGDESNSSSVITSDSIDEEQDEMNVFDNGYYILGDWENYEQCIQFNHAGSFGKVIQSTDYVTHGKQSARLEIYGYSYQWGYSSPQMHVSTVNDYFEKQSFADCDLFAFDMYSVMDYDLTMQFKITGTENKSSLTILTIKPGWNYFEISRTDLGPRWLDEISRFSFIFDKGINHEETQTVYIDNFRARKMAE